MTVFHGFEDVKIAQKWTIFTFKALENYHMTRMRYFLPSHIICIYINLLFGFMVYGQILLTNIIKKLEPPMVLNSRAHCAL